MESNFKIEGVEELKKYLENNEMSEQKERNILKKVGEIIKSEVEKNTPKKTGKLKKNVMVKIKKLYGGTSVIVDFNNNVFWDIFQEFGTSKQRKNIGFFSRSINNVEEEVLRVIKNEVYK